MTKIISLFAGPGAGKSTSAAYIYAQLKNKGLNVELVREYVKDWAWEGRQPEAYDQFYLLGKQIRKESLVLGRVEFAITDSPVWLCAYYAEKYSPPLIRNGVEACVSGYYQQCSADGHEHINLWIDRIKPYNPEGRFQDEEQARMIDNQLSMFLGERGVALRKTTSAFEDLDSLVKSLVSE